MLDKYHFTVLHIMQINILKMTVVQSFVYIGALIAFKRLNQLRITNTTTVAIKKRLDVIKAQNGRHIIGLV